MENSKTECVQALMILSSHKSYFFVNITWKVQKFLSQETKFSQKKEVRKSTNLVIFSTKRSSCARLTVVEFVDLPIQDPLWTSQSSWYSFTHSPGLTKWNRWLLKETLKMVPTVGKPRNISLERRVLTERLLNSLSLIALLMQHCTSKQLRTNKSDDYQTLTLEKKNLLWKNRCWGCISTIPNENGAHIFIDMEDLHYKKQYRKQG